MYCPPPVNGSCGPSNGQTMPSAPAAGLCNAGTPSAVSGSGPWNWTCAGSNGGGNAGCVAYRTPAPSCGTNARTYLSTETNYTGTFCAVGSANPANPSFPTPGGSVNWTCANAAGSAGCAASRWNVLNPPSNLQASCNAAGNQVSLSWTGSAGANYYPLRVDDKTNGWDGSCASPDQCIDISGTSYTRAVVPGRDYRAWVHACRSADGQCTSPAILDNFRCNPPPVNGTCGPAARSYAHNETAYSGAFCSSGSPSPANSAFPAQGGSSAWSCSGSNGGSSANCTATRGVPPVCTGTRPTNTTVHPGDDTGLAANTAWTYSAANTAPKCQYYCSSGYNWNGSSCAPIVTGSCGPSNGQTMPSAPTSGLCNAGTPSAVSGSGPWNWTCAGSNGGGNASCTAYPPSAVNAICGSNQPASFRYEANVNSWPSTNQTAFCQSGSLTPSSPLPVFPAQGGNTTWNCAGSNGGINAFCTAQRKLEGICGPSDGLTMPTAPTGGLCTSGSSTAVSGTGPWTWSCAGANGGITRSCSANKTNGPILMFTGFDAGNASNSGSEITIPYGGAVLLTWSTQHVASCQASDGSGSWANPNKPTSGTDERYENIRSETTFTLNCVGIDGSPIAGSVIVRVPAAENAECGDNQQTYPATTNSWPSTSGSAFCSTGTLSGSTPSFPGQGSSVSWTCNGSNGGSTASCTASRLDLESGQCDTSVSCATSKPTTKLCTKGSPGTVSGTGPWTWTCSGTPPADCSRSKCKGSPYKEVTP